MIDTKRTPIWTEKHLKIIKEFRKSDAQPIIYESFSDYSKSMHNKNCGCCFCVDGPIPTDPEEIKNDIALMT